MKTIELKINEIKNVKAISLVFSPAIEEDFMYFNQDKINYTFAKTDEDKRIVTGPALIPDKLIYRYNRETGEEYNIFFSKDTVEQIMHQYLKDNRNGEVTLQHEEDVNDVSLVEAWTILKSDNDKSNVLGFNLPEGTMMISMKVDNDKIWQEVKDGKAKGFSIEGMFIEQVVSMNKEQKKKELTDEEKLIEVVKELLKNE